MRQGLVCKVYLNSGIPSCSVGHDGEDGVVGEISVGKRLGENFYYPI